MKCWPISMALSGAAVVMSVEALVDSALLMAWIYRQRMCRKARR